MPRPAFARRRVVTHMERRRAMLRVYVGCVLRLHADLAAAVHCWTGRGTPFGQQRRLACLQTPFTLCESRDGAPYYGARWQVSVTPSREGCQCDTSPTRSPVKVKVKVGVFRKIGHFLIRPFAVRFTSPTFCLLYRATCKRTSAKIFGAFGLKHIL